MTCEALLAFLLNAAWQVAVIAAVAALAARCLRRAPSRYEHALWLAALGLSVVMPLSSLRTGWSLREVKARHTGSSYAIRLGREAAHLRSQIRIESPASSLRVKAKDPTRATRFGWRSLLASHSRAVPLPSFWVYVLVAGYCLSIAFGAVRLLRAWMKTCALRRTAYSPEFPPSVAAEMTRCVAAFGAKRVPILCCGCAPGPLTLGSSHPVVILPTSLIETGSFEDLAAALAHEMAHIRRRDYAINLICEFAHLLVAFHPAAAIIRRRIDQSRELACDEMAAGALVSARTYARSLVSLAQAITGAESASGYSLGVIDGSNLEERVMRLLENRTCFDSRLTAISLAAAAALLGLTVLGVTAFSLTPRLPVAAATAEGFSSPPEQSRKALLGGDIYDPSGAAVPGAKVLLVNEKTGEKWTDVSGATGNFHFERATPGRYSLTVEKPGFAPYSMRIFRMPRYPLEIVLEPGSVLESLIVTARAPAVANSAPSVHGQMPERIRVGGLVEATKLLKRVVPAYPESAREKGLQGTVLLEGVISKQGVPLSLRVLESPDPSLAAAARDAVMQWRYEPTLLNGAPIEVVTTITVMFRLIH